MVRVGEAIDEWGARVDNRHRATETSAVALSAWSLRAKSQAKTALARHTSTMPTVQASVAPTAVDGVASARRAAAVARKQLLRRHLVAGKHTTSEPALRPQAAVASPVRTGYSKPLLPLGHATAVSRNSATLGKPATPVTVPVSLGLVQPDRAAAAPTRGGGFRKLAPPLLPANMSAQGQQPPRATPAAAANVTRGGIRDAHAVFEQFDLNSDGMLDGSEVMAMMFSLGFGSVNAEYVSSLIDGFRPFEHSDRDHNAIGKAEFPLLWQYLGGESLSSQLQLKEDKGEEVAANATSPATRFRGTVCIRGAGAGRPWV
jgi:hypothetical protein